MVFGVPFLITAALQFTVPLSLPRGSLTPAIPPAGIVLILVGSVLIILARRELLKHNRPIRETQPASWSPPVFSLFQGILSTSTKFVFVVGIALALGLAWVLVRLLPALIACPYILIVLEEQYPTEKFGEEYHTYAASVHRWIGHTRQGESE